MTNLTAAIPQLALVPQCAVPAFDAIAADGCGPELACICGNDQFFLTLQGVILKGSCTVSEAKESLNSVRNVCITAAPWLNDNRGPEIVVAITIVTIVATIAVIMRCIARRVSHMAFGVDDWLIIVALVCSYGVTITQYFAVHNGFGRHILMLDLDQITAFTKAYFATTVLFPTSISPVKLSILFFYLRIFPSKRFRNIAIVIGLIVIANFISWTFLNFFTCMPLAYFWNKAIPGGHCMDGVHVGNYWTGPFDVSTNIAILVLPIPYLWNLQMQRIKKVAITGIFILGGFATVGSIVRFPFLAELQVYDVSYTIVNPGIWLNVEANIGILSACLPILRPLLSKHFSSSIRSRFTRSRTARSQRLPDVEKNAARSSFLNNNTQSTTNNSIYQGGEKIHRTWYNNAVTAIATGKNTKTESETSREEMVPMGKIAVTQDLDWEERSRLDPVTPPEA